MTQTKWNRKGATMLQTSRLRSVLAASLAAIVVLSGCTAKLQTPGADEFRADKGCKIGMLPKTTADPNFQAMAKGAREEAEKLGYEFEFNGPTTLDSAGQIQFIEQWTRQQFCGIAVSASDPDALRPAVEAAEEAGVAVTTYDAAVNSKDVLHLAPFSIAAMGESFADEAVNLSSPSAKIYILTSSMTAPNQSAWIDALKKALPKKYPDAEIQTIQPGEGDTQRSYNTANAWLQAHSDTDVVIALDGSALQGASQAIEALGLTGKVGLTGIGVPSQNKVAITGGAASSFFLYDSPQIGADSIDMTAKVMAGELKPGDKSVELNGKTREFMDRKTILYAPPLKFTEDNIDKYDF